MGYYINLDSQSDTSQTEEFDAEPEREHSEMERPRDDSATYAEAHHSKRTCVVREPPACTCALPGTCMHRNDSSGTYIGDMLMDAVVQEHLLGDTHAEAADTSASGVQPTLLHCWFDWGWMRPYWCLF